MLHGEGRGEEGRERERRGGEGEPAVPEEGRDCGMYGQLSEMGGQ